MSGRFAAGPFAPLVVGVALQAAGVLVIELPPVLLVVAYALIGRSIGLRFTRAILLYALRALPMVLGPQVSRFVATRAA